MVLSTNPAAEVRVATRLPELPDAVASRPRIADSARGRVTGRSGQEVARFTAIAEQTSDLVGMRDATGRLYYLNPAGRALLDIAPDVDDAGDLDLLVRERTAHIADALREATEHGIWSGEREIIDGAGTAIPVSLVVVAHRDADGELEFYSVVGRDLRERRSTEQALHRERERYQTLVAQAPVGIYRTDAAGAPQFVNERCAEIFGLSIDDPPPRWAERIHPEDRPAVHTGWTGALEDGAEWNAEYRLVVDGTIRWVSTSARPLRDAHGAVTGFLGTVMDVTQRRETERARRRAAAEQAARTVADAASARLRALVDGLAAIVWEADARSLEFSFVSDRAEELLGYGVPRWLHDAGFWPSIIHPDDREEALRSRAEATAACRDHDFSYRACTADGRVIWLHDVVHVTCGDDGGPARLQGVMIDITTQKRAERSTVVLAESGRLLAGPDTPERKLAALARLLMTEFADLAVVSSLDPDGLMRRVAVAHPDPDVVRTVLALPPTRLADESYERFLTGRPTLLPISDELIRKVARDEADAQDRAELGACSALTVPLVADGDVLGVLAFLNLGQPRSYADAELELAEELGRRAATMMQAERRHQRQRQLQQVTADLAAAGTVVEAGRRLAGRLATVLGATASSVYLTTSDERLELVHAVGYPDEHLARFAGITVHDPVPLAGCVRRDEPVWLRDLAECQRDYPHLVDHADGDGTRAAAALPLRASGGVIGALGLSFGTARRFPAAEREFILALVAHAASASNAPTSRTAADTSPRPCSRACSPSHCRCCRSWRWPPATSPGRSGHRPAATGTTCCRSTSSASRSSSATSSGRARPRPP